MGGCGSKRSDDWLLRRGQGRRPHIPRTRGVEAMIVLAVIRVVLYGIRERFSRRGYATGHWR